MGSRVPFDITANIVARGWDYAPGPTPCFQMLARNSSRILGASLDWHEAGGYPAFCLPSLEHTHLHAIDGELYITGSPSDTSAAANAAFSVYRVQGIGLPTPEPSPRLLRADGAAPPAFAVHCAVVSRGAVWVLGSHQRDARRRHDCFAHVYRGTVDREEVHWEAVATTGCTQLRGEPPPLHKLQAVAWGDHVAVLAGGGLHLLCTATRQWANYVCAPGEGDGLLLSHPDTLLLWRAGALHSLTLDIDPAEGGGSARGDEGRAAAVAPVPLSGPSPGIRHPNVLVCGRTLFVFRGQTFRVDVAARECTELVSFKRRGCKEVSCNEYHALAVAGGRAFAACWSVEYTEDMLLYAELPPVPWDPEWHALCHPRFKAMARHFGLSARRLGLATELAECALTFCPWTAREWAIAE